MKGKIAIVLQAGTEGGHEALARAFHAVLYARELFERGHEVRLVFDGAGTTWLASFHQAEAGPQRGIGDLFLRLRGEGLTYAVCDYCSGAFGVRETLAEKGEPLVSQYLDHPSIAELVEQGFQVWVL